MVITHLHGSHKIIPFPGQSADRITSHSSGLQIHFNATAPVTINLRMTISPMYILPLNIFLFFWGEDLEGFFFFFVLTYYVWFLYTVFFFWIDFLFYFMIILHFHPISILWLILYKTKKIIILHITQIQFTFL